MRVQSSFFLILLPCYVIAFQSSLQKPVLTKWETCTTCRHRYDRIRVQHQMVSTTLQEEVETTAKQASVVEDSESETKAITKLSQNAMVERSIEELSEATDDGGNIAEYRRGLLTIGFITLLFASNSPVLHAAFSSGNSPPVLLLNAAVSVVALVGLLFGGSSLEDATPLPSSLLRNKQLLSEEDERNNEIKAGAELGLWKTLGTTANLYGLSLTTADHGAFLIQLTTLIVPVVQGIMGVPIPKRIQFSVALALAGVFLFTQDASGAAAETNTYLGDALCVVAAGFYATYDLRLFKWGKLVAPRNLITNKIATQAFFSILLLAGLGWNDTIDFFAMQSGMESLLPIVLVALWSGVAVNAIAPFLQVGGQQAVGPTRAQTLYASQPLWAAIISFVCFGETIGTTGLIGGTAFLSALALAATAEAPDPNCGQDDCEV